MLNTKFSDPEHPSLFLPFPPKCPWFRPPGSLSLSAPKKKHVLRVIIGSVCVCQVMAWGNCVVQGVSRIFRLEGLESEL